MMTVLVHIRTGPVREDRGFKLWTTQSVVPYPPIEWQVILEKANTRVVAENQQSDTLDSSDSRYFGRCDKIASNSILIFTHCS